MVKLNLGCGANKIKGCINIDIEPSCKPDLIADFKTRLPFEDSSVAHVYLFHVIEHIEERSHKIILSEIFRVLEPAGRLFISYPEFIKVAQNYINNYRGQREFWKNTIYGRQLYKSDYHVALMDSQYFKALLLSIGFVDVIIKPEPIEEYNTIIRCLKGEKTQTYEDILRDSIFNTICLR